MRTELPQSFLLTPDGPRADAILRSCVHCGMCNATCPTYQVLGDELDGPRGRIYLMKEMFEAGAPNDTARTHLDRCLTCRACETTCPSGVRYGELLEIGREFVEEGLQRSWTERLVRRWLTGVIPSPVWLRRWLRLGHAFRAFAPRRLRAMMARPAPEPAARDGGNVLLLQGCVQRVMTPETNDHLATILAARGIALRTDINESCCGGLALHLGNGNDGRDAMRRNLDAIDWADAQRIVSTASGCGVTLKDYGRVLGDDPAYAGPARAFAGKVQDVAELLTDYRFEKRPDIDRVAWHAPCTLQHGQKITGLVERLLTDAGYELVPVRDPHLCCGSAGSYSMLQPEISTALRDRKAAALTEHRPDAIATANIGCQMHLGDGVDVPVLHWVQLLE